MVSVFSTSAQARAVITRRDAFGDGLGVFGVRPAQDVTGILDDDVLKSAAGAEEGPPVFTRKTNRP